MFLYKESKTEEKSHRTNPTEFTIELSIPKLPDEPKMNFIEEKFKKIGSDDVYSKKYVVGRKMGKGGFAKCYEVIDLEGKSILAAKIIDKKIMHKPRAKQKMINEIRIHKTLNHPHIVKFESFFEDNNFIYILLELCSHQTMHELIKRRKQLTEVEVRCYLWQLISALRYLHSNSIIHRDLKLGNMFLNDNLELKIGDFGLATRLRLKGERKKSVCGTPNYIAPEVLINNCGHSYEVDIWALGVISYTLLFGRSPFQTQDVKVTYRRIKNGQYTFPRNSTVSERAKNLIKAILVKEPEKRPNLDQILNHPFFVEPIPRYLPLASVSDPPPVHFLKEFVNKNITDQSRNRRSHSAHVVKSNKNTEDINFYEKNKIENLTEKNTQKDPVDENLNKTIDSKDTIVKKTSPHDSFTFNYIEERQDKLSNMFNNSCVCIKSWMDYSSKFGIATLLNNGTLCVTYLDRTKLICEIKNTRKLYYLWKRFAEKEYNIKELALDHKFTEQEEPSGRKIKIFQNFMKSMRLESGELHEEMKKKSEDYSDKSILYVKKWKKSRYAYFFKLSTGQIQINYHDNSAIFINSDKLSLNYVSNKGLRKEVMIRDVLMENHPDISKRIQFFKEHLQKILKKKKKVDELMKSSFKVNKNFSLK